MAVFRVTNKGKVVGTADADRLVFTYDTATNDVWLRNLSGSLDTGYSGTFDGLGSNDCAFTGIENFTFIDKSGGNDDIRTGDGDDVLRGGAGNDNLIGRGGIDIIDGGAGSDFWGGDLSGAANAILIDLNARSSFLGTGSVVNVEGMDLMTGSGRDRITGHATSGMSDTIDSGGGNDVITLTMGGTDTVNGGAGSDLLVLRYAIDTNDIILVDLAGSLAAGYSGTFNGLGGNDCIFTGIERFSFTDLSGGNDVINTGDGNDVLNGGAGDDVLNGAGGVDKVNGGTGSDRWGADLSAAGEAIVIDLNARSTFLGSGSVANVEGMDLRTGSGNDRITGHATSRLSDTVDSGAGNDVISLSMGGSDSVNGGAGTDFLVLRYAIETNDVWLIDIAGSLATGYSGTFNGLGGNDCNFTGIERFSFTDLAGGNDNIRTGDGDDLLKGGAGNDTLMGRGGRDKLDGGTGDDAITGGRGADRMSGGAGSDLFVFDRTQNEGRDTVTDFADGIDRIQILGSSFEQLDLAVVNASDLQITLASGTTIILQDTGFASITAADFLFA